ncbi:MAG: methyltransferase domain-containing protein [Acidobacteriota bacterium]
MVRRLLSQILTLLLIAMGAGAQSKPVGSSDPSAYEQRTVHDPDGIGRFYFGREIARVMGHEGAEWLERPDREQTELPSQVVEQMQLKSSAVVADIGAGTGYFTFRIADRVPRGRVYAVDIQREMLDIIAKRRQSLKLNQVVTIEGSETDVRLPAESVDVTLMVDAYHEFAWPREMMASIVRGLKPGGRVILVEYRGEDLKLQIKRVHKMTVAQATREMAAAGLTWKETRDFLPYQHFMVFEKPGR